MRSGAAAWTRPRTVGESGADDEDIQPTRGASRGERAATTVARSRARSGGSKAPRQARCTRPPITAYGCERPRPPRPIGAPSRPRSLASTPIRAGWARHGCATACEPPIIGGSGDRSCRVRASVRPPTGTSFNGRTPRSGRGYRGSNPCVPATSLAPLARGCSAGHERHAATRWLVASGTESLRPSQSLKCISCKALPSSEGRSRCVRGPLAADRS